MAVIAHQQGKTIYGGGDSFWTECSCGWQGDPRSFEEHLGQEIESLTQQLRGAVDLLREVANCSPAFEDRRMGYVEVQIDWPTWDELAAYRGQ